MARIRSSKPLADRLVRKLAADSSTRDSGAAWMRTAGVLVAATKAAKGRSDLVRVLAAALFNLPVSESIKIPPKFVTLMERHATQQMLQTISGPALPATQACNAIVQAVGTFQGVPARDRLVTALAAHQPDLWNAHCEDLCSEWGDEDWQRLLRLWGSSPKPRLSTLDRVLQHAPEAVDVDVFRAAIAHSDDEGDALAGAASEALRRIAAEAADENETDPARIAGTIPWELIDNDHSPTQLVSLSWILKTSLEPATQAAVVVNALTDRHVTVAQAVSLTPEGQWDTALRQMPAGGTRADYAATALATLDREVISEALVVLLQHKETPVDIIEAIAETDPTLAFAAVDEDRWHALAQDERDRLLTQLERHATVDQLQLLDLIARDSDSSNTARRSRAAVRWAQVTPRHSLIPTGVFSLLESARPTLNEAFAAVASTVHPHDESTLLRLREKSIAGGKPGDAARDALNDVAAGLVDSIGSLSGPDRWSAGPELLRLLGVTAAPVAFDSLISYVGADGRDDNLGLRQAAASAIRFYIEVTRLDHDQLERLSKGLEAEPDPQASAQLRSAIRAAELGEDAAILALYDFAGIGEHEVRLTPDELFGDEKPRLLTALKRMATQQALGEAAWNGYVEQMDLVGEALTRAAYVKFGTSDSLVQQIRSQDAGKPDYGNLVGALGQVTGLLPASTALKALHHTRSTRTSAHHPVGGELDAPSITTAEGNLRVGATDILRRILTSEPTLRAVPSTGNDEAAS